MEITFYEDPGCSWCWAFQPVATRFAYEFRHVVKSRLVMGGLRDRPAADINFVVQQWKTAQDVSGMPFETRVWQKRALRTTYLACRAVKAVSMMDEADALLFLRRLREAFFVEEALIDEQDTLLTLAGEVGLDATTLEENLLSGRAEALFARDRLEAAQYGFGFPTILLRGGPNEPPRVLQGSVPYGDILQALFSLGIPPCERRRFKPSRESWVNLFKLRRRLTRAEIHMVTGADPARWAQQLETEGAGILLKQCGPFFELIVPGECSSSSPPLPPGGKVLAASPSDLPAATACEEIEMPSPDSQEPIPLNPAAEG